MSDDEFLGISPAAFDALLRRLQVRDRKGIQGSAMICAEMYNLMRDRQMHPDPFCAADFLPEIPEERARRLAEEEASRNAPIDPVAFAAFKEGLLSIGKKPGKKA